MTKHQQEKCNFYDRQGRSKPRFPLTQELARAIRLYVTLKDLVVQPGQSKDDSEMSLE
jgi:hypothetical protein